MAVTIGTLPTPPVDVNDDIVVTASVSGQTLSLVGNSIQINSNIDGGSIVSLATRGGKAGSVTIGGKIDGGSVVFISTRGGATPGDVTLTGKIDGTSLVTIDASGNVLLGTTGGADDQKIDGGSTVDVTAGGNITLGGYMGGSGSKSFRAHGAISLGHRVTAWPDNTPISIEDGATVRLIADGDVTLGAIANSDSTQAKCHVELVSNEGSVTMSSKIDNGNAVTLSAGKNIAIGSDTTLSDDNRKIDGDSFVSATAGGAITLGSDIKSSHTCVDFAACGGVTIGKGISGGASVRLLSASGTIAVTDAITDSGTNVTFFSGTPFKPVLQNGATATQVEWTPAATLCPKTPQAGYWWENWSQTYGYVLDSNQRVVPHSLDELVAAVQGAPRARGGDPTPVKAVGGGWSFSDASLPFQNQADVDSVSIKQRGQSAQQDLHGYLDGLADAAASGMDLVPQAVRRNYAFSTSYDGTALRQKTNSGVQLPPAPSKVRLIDTRALASTLQGKFNFVTPNPLPNGNFLFHVEAGITIADLQQLLDHQSPRLAMRATGGSPGATLAGTLSTATHGGEFHWQLLIDTVRAIHLVGPGGTEWWIEGDTPVVKQTDLPSNVHYVGGGSWTGITGHPEITPQDVLNAVIVSMGTMGVIYSVVLEVVPQFGIQQTVTPTTWPTLLQKAGVKETDLLPSSPTKTGANQKVLAFLRNALPIDNGTMISQSENVYIDLAINPLNLDCWITNRKLTASFPDDADPAPLAPPDAASGLRFALSLKDNFHGDKLIGRLLNFWQGATDDADIVTSAFCGHLTGWINFITGSSDPQTSALALAVFKTRTNIAQGSAPINGLNFLGDFLTGFFHALEGTAPNKNANSTGIAYKVGAIGWPDSGLPGRGFEIAMDPDDAFTFLQTVIIDDVIPNEIVAKNQPLVGYISVRITPRTNTLMGIQQYGTPIPSGDPAGRALPPVTAIIEIVAYRSPESNKVMDAIAQKALRFGGTGGKPLLHWGLENGPDFPFDPPTDLHYDSAYLKTTPLGQPYKSGSSLSHIEAFHVVRESLRGAAPPVFDNNFTARLGL